MNNYSWALSFGTSEMQLLQREKKILRYLNSGVREQGAASGWFSFCFFGTKTGIEVRGEWGRYRRLKETDVLISKIVQYQLLMNDDCAAAYDMMNQLRTVCTVHAYGNEIIIVNKFMTCQTQSQLPDVMTPGSSWPPSSTLNGKHEKEEFSHLAAP